MRGGRCWIFAVALGLASPLPASAQAPAPVKSDPFDLGREAFARGDYARALTLFRRSNAQEPGLGKLANIARTEARLGLVGSAMRHFREVTDKLPANDPLRAAIAREVLDVESRVPHLRVSLAPGAPPGTAVTVDREPLAQASLGKDVPVDPGKHVVRATAPGLKERLYEVTVGERGRGVVDVMPAPPFPSPEWPAPSPVPGPEAVTPSPPVSSHRVSPLVAAGFGVGGVGIAVGAITGGLSWAKTSSLEAHCQDQTCPRGDGDALASARSLAIASNVTFGIGAAGVVVGIVGLVLPKPKAAVARSVGPVIGPGEIGVQGVF